MVMKAGKASVISCRFIFFTESSMSTPTMISAPLVAALGMSKKIGERNKESKNIPPTTSEVTPERPPSAIPLALSI